MGQSDFVLDIETFDSQAVANRLIDLESRCEIVKQQIKSNVAVCRARLGSQYRELGNLFEHAF